MHAAGVMMVRMVGAPSLPARHKTAVLYLYEIVNEALPQTLDWDHETCTINLLTLAGGDAAAQRQVIRQLTGPPCLEWLPMSEIRGIIPCGAPSSLALGPLDARILAAGRTVQEVVTWTHTRTGTMTFRKDPTVDGGQVKLLLIHLLAHYPELVFSSCNHEELRVRASPVDHPLIITIQPTQPARMTTVIAISASLAEAETVLTVRSRPEAIAATNLYAKHDIRITDIHPHPSLCRMVCLWTKKKWRKKSRHTYKMDVQAAPLSRGRLKVADRALAWVQDNPQIAEAINHVSWLDIRRVTGATGWGEQILYRFKMQAFRWWDSTRQIPGCPVDECLQQKISTAHTFWECPGAAALWKVFFAPWSTLGLPVKSTDSMTAFKMDLTHVPAGVWKLLDALHCQDKDEDRDQIRGHIQPILHRCWALGVITTLQGIWKRRCLYRERIEDMSAQAAAAVLHGRLRSAYLTIRRFATSEGGSKHCLEAAKVCYIALTSSNLDEHHIPRPTSREEHRLLFFDGGSRGNPGPGGAGAVIVQVGGGAPLPTILWMASASYVTRTTNNAAEYQGLLIGLRYALRHQLYGLKVIGDSKLILTQLLYRKTPKARHLQGRYAQCRQIADILMITSWTHHLREFNKMADKLANLAMNAKTSVQVAAADIPRLPSHWTSVVESLQGDVSHWIDNLLDPEASCRASNNIGAT